MMPKRISGIITFIIDSDIRMMPKPVRRVGVKASGVQQVMATEQETKLTIVVKKRTNCNSSH